MSDQTQNTLFRFRATRTPELISQEKRQNYYVEHPTGSTGHFYTAMTPPPVNKRLGMESAATGFIPSALDLDSVIALNPNLYEFGILLLSKRLSIKYVDISLIVPGLTVLSGPNKIILWDNLFYQIITQESPYIREAIIYLLKANHFVTGFNALSITNDEQTKRWADLNIVLPVELFKIEEDYHTSTTIPNTAKSNLVKKHVEIAENVLRAKLAVQAVKELEVIERNYHETQMAAEKAYVISYNNTLKNDVLTSPKVMETDQISGYQFETHAAPFSPADFTYEPTAEIDLGVITAGTTPISYYALNNNGLLVGKSFSEVKEDVSKYVKECLKPAYSFTGFSVENADVNGTSIPTCSLDNRYNKKNSYLIKPIKKATNTYAIILSVDVKDSCLQLTSATVTIATISPTILSRFNSTNSNGVITIEFLPDATITSTTTIGTVGELVFNNGLVLSWNQSMEMTYGSFGVMEADENSEGNQKLFIPSGYGLRKLGVEDYLKVDQSLCGYLPGEVSHIENILAREYKERSTRRLRRSEDTTTVTSETESESMTDTTSTNRFDMQKEIASVIQSSREFGITGSLHVGAGYSSPNVTGGPTFDASIDVGANFATSSSKEQSTRNAVNIAQEITQKALERVVSKIKEERVTKIIEEFEEQNKHGFDNRQGEVHISGVYRWVDAHYINKVYKYNMRTQYEFMIPEPAAFHLIAKAAGVSSGNEVPLIRPKDPRKDQFGQIEPLKTAASIDDKNYQFWAAAYNAEVTPPPPKVQVVGKTYRVPDDGKPWYEGTKGVTDMIPLPEGYGLRKAYVAAMGETVWIAKDKQSWSRYYISVGDNTREYWCGNIHKQMFLEDNATTDLEHYTDSIPVAVQFVGINGGIVTITLDLLRKEEVYTAWQLETYKAIIDAYEAKLLEYNSALAEMEAKKGVQMGDNPAYYREIEQIVLKKNCIAYLIGHTNMGKSHISGDEMKNFNVKITSEMDKYAATVKFMEQAFEWNIMSYNFYPFYWAGADSWLPLYGHQNDDPTFKAFLQSGMARVVVTVRPGFEKAVAHYIETGQIWNGGEVPVIGDPLYLSIIEEMKNIESDGPIGKPWLTKVPTTLTIVQKDTVSLDASGLPYWCTTGAPTEAFTPEPDALSNLQVFIEGYSLPEEPPVV
jgi:hypothetical protein